MEVILRFLFLPISLVASMTFCFLIRAVLLKWPRITSICWRISLAGAVAVGVCIALSFWPGLAYLGPNWRLPYLLLYRFCFIIGPPVVAALLVVRAMKTQKGGLATFVLPSVVCFAVCAVFLFGDIAMYEAAQERRVVGDYRLEQWEDFRTYYLHKDALEDQKEGGSFIGGVVLRIGWSGRYIVADRHAFYGGDRNGWMIIDVQSGEMSGPFSDNEFQTRSEAKDIQIYDVNEAWKKL